MPHVIVEYSGNIEPDVDMSAVCELLRSNAANIEAFPMPGIRVRAYRADHYAIADGDPVHGFIHVTVRLRGGRSLKVRQQATQLMFDALKDSLASTMLKRSIALSLEMCDIDPELSPKIGTIRDHLENH